jgi:AdoMet-dependent heme synthase
MKSGIIKNCENALVDDLPPKRNKINPDNFSRFSIPFLSAPSSVDVFITGKCNLSCVHCFSSTKEPVDLSLDVLESIFNQLEAMGVLEVRINGGEPVLHPEISRILQMLEHRCFRKVILTNGTLLSDEIVKQLKKSNITPTVSLDDSDAVSHDLFRGIDGTFKKTLAGLKSLHENRVQYGINCCLHSKNLEKVEKIVNLGLSQGASRIAFLSLKSLGRMRNHKEWIPSQKEYETILQQLLFLKAKHSLIDVSSDVFLSCPVMEESALEAKKGYISCKAGRTIMSIFSDGFVYPCNCVLGDPKWKMGDSRIEPLSDIWFSRNWSFFRGAVKVNDLKTCRNCKEIKRCPDFYCRLLPYSSTGDPFGPSAKCAADSKGGLG